MSAAGMLGPMMGRSSRAIDHLRKALCSPLVSGVGSFLGPLGFPQPLRLPSCPGNFRGLQQGNCPYPGADTVKPLDGVRILDLTRVLAGPFATMNLGDLGAEIIKVEKPGSGDDTRSWGPPFVGTESVYFLSVNRNKKSIAINMKKAKGAKIIKEVSLN
ncbi:putative CaiB-baiF CoA-transferase family protein [Naja naja]|nr:putative CaiB-baiF CoA-transferase family protein [Naja naja]